MTGKTIEKYHRSYAKIDLSAISSNLFAVKSCLNPGVKAMAVVKANAYGHGILEVSVHIESEVDYFAVATIEEALALREGGIKKDILILSYTSPSDYEALIDNNITATIYNKNEAELLSSLAAQRGEKAKVHLAVDTGMGRIGFDLNVKSADEIKEISELEGIYLEGLFSHYATADCEDKTDCRLQCESFKGFIGLLEKRGVKIPLKHICNSAGAMENEEQFDMCRIGIALYGLYPSDEVKKEKIRLLPAMEVFSHVVHLKTVPKGFKVGYGHIYEAPSERKIATVCIGYADGFRRSLTGVGYVLIGGKKAPLVGKVCMDMIMVDVTEIENVSVGERVVVLGKSGEEEITAEALGEMSGSFNYEVICSFSPRVTRIY